jgi:hypothetical protein
MKEPEGHQVSEKQATGGVHQLGWELERGQRTAVELAGLEGRRLLLGHQLAETQQCRHDDGSGSEIVGGRQRHRGNPMTVQWGQTGVVPRESVSRVMLRKWKARRG